MFKKDRKIANQKAMIENRDKLIGDLQEQKDYYKQMTREQRERLTKQDEVIESILRLASSNTYNNDKIVLSKIKELAKTAILD